MTIGLDIDGVLANFYEAYERAITQATGRDLFPETVCGVDRYPNRWNWPQDEHGYTGEEITKTWDSIKASKSFWYFCRDLGGAREFLKDLSRDHITYFITDRPGTQVQEQTALWLSSYMSAVPSVILTQGRSKGRICEALSVDLFLDDKWENVRSVMEVSPMTTAVLMLRPYNQDGWTRAKHTVSSLEEFKEKFLR